jgi:pimeloyl-ACP methyl ester carboxylesterase
VSIAVPFQPHALKTPSLAQARAYWYQWFLGTSTGEKVFRADPLAFGKRMWDTWSPEDWYKPEHFAQTSKSWTNPDFADVTLHSYRVRWGHAEPDPAYGVLQARYESMPALDVPTLLIHGMEDRATLAETTDGAGRYFTNGYRRMLVEGAGHFVQMEAPELVAEEIVRHLRTSVP